jgi:Putative transposase/Transposase zinc-binding domain
MTRQRPEVADVFREHADTYLATYGATTAQRRVLRAVENCRTAALGGHVEACDHCDHRRIAYNSCRNRHCPKCQGAACARWMQARAAELLPVPYFHLVFTLPAALSPLALQNPRLLYGLLFQAASQTLLEVAADPRHLGAEIGFLAVLHTWGQNLMHHPHLHCVIPGGGISPSGAAWVRSRKDFFLPVRVLSRVFRGKFIAGLKRALACDKLQFHGALAELADPNNFERLIDQVVRQDWVVYAKRPFGGPRQVLKYLARYTHRVAISNRRLVSFRGGQITFRWKDYAHGSQSRLMTLPAVEFIRRFLLHVLPTGLMKIRHYGFMANRFRTQKHVQCRRLLQQPDATPLEPSPEASQDFASSPAADVQARRCPQCGQGRLQVIEKLVPVRFTAERQAAAHFHYDTS